jgi:hypothetical protein
MPEIVELDWSSAEVTDGKLTLGFSQKPPKKWRDAFARTVALLNHGNWKTALSARKGSVEVDPVHVGDEERVRQLLEGAALEANTTLVGEDELFADPHSDDEDDDAPERSSDSESTARFRAFAGVGIASL